MVMDLPSAEELMPHVVTDDTLREELAQAIFYAEDGDICNDVFLFNYVDHFAAEARRACVDFVLR